MADEQEKSEEQLLKEQIAAIEADEKAQADAARVAAMRLRVKRDALRKETEKRLGGPEGKAFEIVEADDGLLVVVSKPSPVIWKAFQKEERNQENWERLYRACVDDAVWEKLSKQLEDSPLGVENAIVSAIMRLQGSRLEVHAKK